MHMIPATPYDTRSRAELKVFDLLRGVELRGDEAGSTIAYHSLNLTRHPTKRFGEIDFLICGPRGLMVLEIKGGGVKCIEGRWRYSDRQGREHERSESPFRQAEGALHGLLQRLREKFGADTVRSLDVGFGVVLPDCEWPLEGAEWDAATLADARACRWFDRWLERLHTYWEGKTALGRKRPPDPAWLAEVQAFLRPTFEKVIPLGLQLEQLAERQVTLTEDQYAWADIAEANPRTLCTGGAGTGKTFLAAELARRWTATDKKVLLVCVSPWLKAWLATQLPMPGLTVATCDAAAIEARRAGIEQFDALIVDEAQDLMQLSRLATLERFLRGGWQAGQWCLFGDFQNQAGLLGTIDNAALQRIDACLPARVPLRTNCRNTLVILESIKSLLGADMGVRGTGHGPPVRYRVAGNRQESAQLLADELQDLFDGGLAYANISILSPLSFETSSAGLLPPRYRRMIRALDHYSIRAFPPRDFIGFASIQDFKGLENDAIIIVDLPKTIGQGDATHAYVGMSRARSSLSIIYQTA